MSTPLKVGQIIPLVCQLEDGDTTKFVNAIVTDQGGIPVAGSPLVLTHTGNGTYENDTLVMPDEDFISATFQVFDDAGLTIPSRHGDTADFFVKSFGAVDVIDCLDQIKDLLNLLLQNIPLPALKGKILDGLNLIGKIEQDYALKGNIEDNKLKGTIKDVDKLVGTIQDDELKGEL